VNIILLNKAMPVRAVPRRLRLAAAAGLASLGSLALSGAALAQAASPAGGIGAQLNLMSGEAIDSGGTAAGMAMYAAALVVFVGAGWALWKSRQPQNRESGYVGMGIAGLVLCGLFATGGTWINKAAMTTGGVAATVTNAPKVVAFQ
jgi:hypothetical protein